MIFISNFFFVKIKMNFFKLTLIISIFKCRNLLAIEQNDWLEHKLTFGKVYSNQNEEILRREIFEKNVKAINKHNKKADAGLVSYRQSINQFTDMTYAELVKSYMGLKEMTEINQNTEANERHSSEIEMTQSLKKRDWRKIPGRVGPIKNQGTCG